MARTHYWMWNGGMMYRVVTQSLPHQHPKGLVKFYFKTRPERGSFYISAMALLPTKKLSKCMPQEFREHNYTRE